MSILKNSLLYAGWIPALAGGGATVWWFESDKTIGDVLSKTGRPILTTKSEFQRVFEQFEEDEEFNKDIEGIATSKAEGLKSWCEESLKLPLNEKNITEVLPKAQKYCLANKAVVKGVAKFKNFKNIFSLLKESLSDKSARFFSMVHLGETSTEDAYYYFTSVDQLENGELTINKSTSREKALGRTLFIDKEHRILDTSGSKDKDLWETRAGQYDSSSEKFLGLTKAIRETSRELGTTRENGLRNHCAQILRGLYKTKEELEKTKKLFIKWCTEEVKLKR